MSQFQLNLCSLILKEHHGDIIEKVALYLMKKGLAPLRMIADDTSLKLDEVKKALYTLLQQNVAYFEKNKRGFVEYGVDTCCFLLRLRFPRFIYTAKTLYGDLAELLVEEMLIHGQVDMNKLIVKVTKRMNDAAQGNETVTENQVREKFANLVQTHFVQRCGQSEVSDDGKMPNFVLKEEDMFAIPMEIDVDSRKRKRSIDDSNQPNKKQKTEESQNLACSECGIYWRINYDRFHWYLRDQAIISAVQNKIDRKAAEVVRTILRLSEVKSDPKSPVTNTVSCNEIAQELPKEFGVTRQALDQYLTLLSSDIMGFIIKAGDSAGGLYAIHFKKALECLCKAHVESVVQERFGSKCLRIFKLLLVKKQLEQKQIEEFAMIPAKEAKELLYRMFGEHFIYLTEVPKTPDHAPSRTFYLFSVNLNQIARILLERAYKATANVILRREFETKENKRLLDKQARVEAIAASLDSSQKEEIEEMITPPERTQLAKVKHMTNKLEQSELQLDETIFILETYLVYAHMS